ncbi:hypothetical protein D3C75_848550 [compost metagenome]
MARPSTSSTMNGTPRRTPRVSKRTWRTNWCQPVAALKRGRTRGAVIAAGRGASALTTAWRRPQRLRLLPVRSVRNRAKVAVNKTAATPSHRARLASR